MVVFLGGCTYTEVAALRFIGRQKGWKILLFIAVKVTIVVEHLAK